MPDIYSASNNAEPKLDAGIGASSLFIPVVAGGGAFFTSKGAVLTGATSSVGTSTTMNKTGIGSLGVVAETYIRNRTDGSYAYIISIDTDSLTTTKLRGGSDNTWESGDTYDIRPFVATIEERTSEGLFVKREKVEIVNVATDLLTVSTGGRGLGGDTPLAFANPDLTTANVFVTAEQAQGVVAMLTRIHGELDETVTQSELATLLNSQNWKEACRVATTANIDISTDLENGDTIDSVVLATGDRVLVKDQTLPKENGIYIVSASGSATRATDFDETEEVATAIVAVDNEAGASNGGSIWTTFNEPPVSVGVDDIVFVQFQGATFSNTTQARDGTDNTTLMSPQKVSQNKRWNFTRDYIIAPEVAGFRLIGGNSTITRDIINVTTLASGNALVFYTLDDNTALPGLPDNIFIYNSNFSYQVSADLTSIPNDADALLGFDRSGSPFPSNGVYTDKHIAFIVGTDGTLYASNADGTTQTTTNLGVPSSPSIYSFLKEGNIIYFFDIKSGLVATHTTNIPTDASENQSNLAHIVYDRASSPKTIKISRVRYRLYN